MPRARRKPGISKGNIMLLAQLFSLAFGQELAIRCLVATVHCSVARASQLYIRARVQRALH